MKRGVFLSLLVWVVVGIAAHLSAAPTKSDATITSDELELKDNGAKTYFRGHVVLTDSPYLLHADRMVRTKITGLIDVHGHIDGTWLSDKGEKVKAYGDDGTYAPTPPQTELWGNRPKLLRWETALDTAPVQVVADRFIAYHDEREFYAFGRVVITQDPKILSRSDKAKYDQKAQTIYLYGPTRVFVHIADAKGSGDFTGETGWVTLDPKTAHMAGHVQGHITPGQTL